MAATAELVKMKPTLMATTSLLARCHLLTRLVLCVVESNLAVIIYLNNSCDARRIYPRPRYVNADWSVDLQPENCVGQLIQIP